MNKSFKSTSKSFNKSVKSVSNIEGMNVVLFVAVIAMILNAKMLKPMVSSMPGKLGLVLFICFLAMTDRVLGLLGVVLFMSVNNGLIEGMREGEEPEDDKATGSGEEIEGLQEGEEEEEEEQEEK
jgi:hypothetical protein